jgi:hypothetical protein
MTLAFVVRGFVRFWHTNGPQVMSAVWLLSGVNRTSDGQPNSVEIDPMYGPAVRCKWISPSWR